MSGAAGSAPPPDDGDNDVCTRLENDYVAALDDAVKCDPKQKRRVCAEFVDASLACPLCKVWVDDKKELDDLRADWKRARCDKRKPVCSFTRCLSPGAAICVPASKHDDEGTCGPKR